MRKKILISAAILCGTLLSTEAQVNNYALQLAPQSSVDCGVMPGLDGLTSYTVQFWINPETWTPGASVFTRGDSFTATLGNTGTLNLSVGASTLALSSGDIKAGDWTQITVVCSEGAATGFVNGNEVASGTLGAIPADATAFVIGGEYAGRIDELRLWKAALAPDFEYFMFNTLNKWCPQWDDLLVYYKMDQDLCPDALVDYRGIYNPDATYNNHGLLKGRVVRADASDNTRMPYLINGAYTANERFFDRVIPRDQYLLSNDLIILGVQSYSDGHLEIVTPNWHGVPAGTATVSDEFNGRKGVLTLDGNGSLDFDADALNFTSQYTFETWVWIDEWVDGAYLFRKETDDKAHGMSISLGYVDNGAKEALIIRVNGQHFRYPTVLKTGQWQHIAIGIGTRSAANTTFALVSDGAPVNPPRIKYFDGSTEYLPSGAENCAAHIGEGFKGKLDETVFWRRSFSNSDIAAHMNEVPQVSLSRQVTAEILMLAGAYFTYDDPEMPGHSYHSQDEWKRIMESAYEGHRGFHTYISVKSHNGWESILTDKTKRERFAADLAKISEPYDGVELDLEWVYGAGAWNNYHELSKAIRAALPEGKGFRVSTHNVTYAYPKAGMDIIDGFTFQQYGPQGVHFNHDHFVGACEGFISYGFPRNKIMTSYSTTTSNGNGQVSGSPIKGVKDGFFTDDYVPSETEEYKTFGNEKFYFTGPMLTYKRAKYTREQNLQGIFYWDMGNDVWDKNEDGSPKMHKYNLAKWCSYGLNANVDTLITEVDVRHIAGIGNIGIDRTGNASLNIYPSPARSHINVNLSSGDKIDTIQVFNLSGAEVMGIREPEGLVDVSSLAGGIYVVTAKAENGEIVKSKFIKE